VNWKSANILNPETYKDSLVGADAVVHSMGILLEADYKGVVSGQVSPIAGLQRAFSATKVGSNKNPMEADSIEPGEKDGQITYELMNRDSAIILANTAAAANVGSYAYIGCRRAHIAEKIHHHQTRGGEHHCVEVPADALLLRKAGLPLRQQ
jgi:hypothetical protein